VELFFDLAYALVIFAAFFTAGSILGLVLGLVVPRGDRRVLLLPAYALALVGWIWFGWAGGRYGISRLGLVAFSAVGAVGFVRGWVLGLQAGRWGRAASVRPRAAGRARARC
jgi:hypothetical protein